MPVFGSMPISVKDFGDLRGRVELAVAEFRVLVEPAAPLDDLRLGFGRQAVELLGADLAVPGQRQ